MLPKVKVVGSNKPIESDVVIANAPDDDARHAAKSKVLKA
jgi:hypothetical protein